MAGPRAGAPPPGQHAQRAARRGVALLHQVGLGDGLSVGARPRAAARRTARTSRPGSWPGSSSSSPGPASSSSTRSPGSAGRSSGRPSPRVRGARSASSSSRAGRRSTREVVRGPAGRARRRGPLLADLGPVDPGGVRSFDPSGCEMRVGDALALLPGLADGSVDFVATDPPYNVQLALTMAGGPLAETHANRRTDYAMVTDDPADFANSADYPTFLDRMEARLRGDPAGPAAGPATPASSSATPTRTAATGSPGRTSRPGPSRSASCRRAISSGTRPARACGRTATRRRSCRTSPTSTSSSCARETAATSRGRRAADRPRPGGRGVRPTAGGRPGTRGGVLAEPVEHELDRLVGLDRRRRASSGGASPACRPGRGPASTCRRTRGAGPRPLRRGSRSRSPGARRARQSRTSR